MTPAPALSILVVAYRMPRQVLNTLYTLTAKYQRDVSAADYEIVLVENASQDRLDPAEVSALAPNITYCYRHEVGVSPAGALNDAIAQARGTWVGLMIDGAHMVTPGLVRNVLDVARMDPCALTVVPGYHLGTQNEQAEQAAGYGEAAEIRLLAGLPQGGDGYGLFQLASLSPANQHGFTHPFMESNCMFVDKERLLQVGGADPRFNLRGGGMLNLDLYRELAELPGTNLWVLPGEGSFHQYHGGTTTDVAEDRQPLLTEFQEQYTAIRGKPYKAPIPEPSLYGEIPASATPWVERAAQRGIDRFIGRTLDGFPVWSPATSDPRQSPPGFSAFRGREDPTAVVEQIERRPPSARLKSKAKRAFLAGRRRVRGAGS